MMRKIVIDTNVIVSAALSGKGNSYEIIDLVSERKLSLYYSEDIMSEYREVLSRDKLRISTAIQAGIIAKIEEIGISLSPAKSDTPLPDETDRMFYDAAIEVKATLITGNTKHYPDEPFIMTPAQFLATFAD